MTLGNITDIHFKNPDAKIRFFLIVIGNKNTLSPTNQATGFSDIQIY